MWHQWRTKLFLGVLALVALGFGARATLVWRAERQFSDVLAQIIPHIPLPAPGDPSDTFDAVRTFVYDASDHKQGEEFYSYWNDRTVMAAGILAFTKGERPTRIHMDCSRRTGILGNLLVKMGYTTRRIDLYDYERDLASQHTILEVLNPVTNSWETQDADYHLRWRDKRSGKRTSVTLTALDNLEPCRHAECGWHLAGEEGQLTKNAGELLDFMVIREKSGKRYTVYSPHVNAEKVFDYKSKVGPYCTVLRKNCRDGLVSIDEHRAMAQLAQSSN